MTTDLAIASLIRGASLLVKLVMLLLLAASLISWALIFKKRRQMRLAGRDMQAFEDEFWSSEDLTGLYNRSKQEPEQGGMKTVFEAGFREFARLRKHGGLDAGDILDGSQRSEEHTSDSSHDQSSYAVFCLKKKNNKTLSEQR